MATGKIKVNFKMPTPTAAERLHAQQQKNRKAAGLPDPSEYKKKLDSMKSEATLSDVDNNPDRPNAGRYSSGSAKPVKRVTPIATPSVNEEDITVVKKGSSIKKKISDASYGVFKSHGFVKEEEQLDELSPATKASYVTKAKEQIKQSEPFTKKGEEYRDIAKNFIAKRQKGIAKANESVTLGRVGGRGNIHQYDRNPGPKDGSELENVPFHAKTDKQKKLQNALNDLGKKMKETHPKLRESKDTQEYDYEGDMAKSDLRSIIHNAQTLHDMIEDNTNLAEWCQSKITLAEDYISTVTNYMRSEMNEETVQEDKNDYQRKIEKNNKNFIAASKRQKNPLTNVHTAQTKQKPVKEDIEQLDEKKKLPGLWANIHAKRKRGEPPAKPGDEDYPKTLNIEAVEDDPKADQMTTDDNKFPKKSRKAAIVKSAAKKMPPEDQFQAKPVLDSQVAQQTNK